MAVGLVVCLAVGMVVPLGKDPLKRTALWKHAKHGLSQTYWKENTLLLVAVAAAVAALHLGFPLLLLLISDNQAIQCSWEHQRKRFRHPQLLVDSHSHSW